VSVKKKKNKKKPKKTPTKLLTEVEQEPDVDRRQLPKHRSPSMGEIPLPCVGW